MKGSSRQQNRISESSMLSPSDHASVIASREDEG